MPLDARAHELLHGARLVDDLPTLPVDDEPDLPTRLALMRLAREEMITTTGRGAVVLTDRGLRHLDTLLVASGVDRTAMSLMEENRDADEAALERERAEEVAERTCERRRQDLAFALEQLEKVGRRPDDEDPDREITLTLSEIVEITRRDAPTAPAG